ncbi:Lrp/AsnC family transcriptional regulator [Chloroflexota bacterium]
MKGGVMKEILEILERDARTTPEQISTMIGIPLAEVEKEIRKAEEERTIVNYKTVINWQRAGEEQVQAMIEVRTQPQKDVGFDAIAERVYSFPQVRSAYLVSGGYDLAVVVVGKTMQEVASFVAKKLAPLEGVQGTVTHFILGRYKEDGEIIDGQEDSKRLPLTL